MAVSNDDISLLVEETFRHCARKEDLNSSGSTTPDKLGRFGQLPEVPINETKSIPKSPGVLYRIELGANTFCIRIFPTINLQASCGKLEEDAENMSKQLKLSDSEEIFDILYYPTAYFELAEIIKDQFSNQRFPLYEEQICNLSDPSFNWWYCEDRNSFTVHFKSRGQIRNNKYLKLGPLGQGELVTKMFTTGASILPQLFPVNEFSCSNRLLTIGCAQNGNINFQDLKKIFRLGHFSDGLIKYFEKATDPSFFHFLVEICQLRKFWVEVQHQIKIKRD